jgi:hypothetical protein
MKMKNIIIVAIFCLIILQGCKGGGYTVTTVYDNCNSPIELIFEDSSQAYILDKSIIYVNEKTTSKNVHINGKFELCFGKECLGHYNPIQIQSNKVILTGRMRESSPKLLLSLFVDTHRDIEAVIDSKRVWINPFYLEDKFKPVDNNKTISFYKKEANSPVIKFQCPLLNKKALDWELSW